MNILEIIEKKKNKENLTYEELDYAFNGYLKQEIPDYQMSALLMAICLNELNEEEIFNLTEIFIKSGEVIDLSKLDGIFIDKHSTGGVGDKTTLVIGPIVAACGLKMPKMSGRGLGLTGGTIDKLESIPGFNVYLTEEEFWQGLKEVGFIDVAQNEKLVPLDKVIYALRDVTGTTESLGLIAVSIMSKKIASGTKNILIDIKYGNGALIKTKEKALEFAEIIKNIGQKYQVKVLPIIDDMNTPLGNNIGNALEVKEAMDILQGKQGKLTDLCLDLSAKLINLACDISYEEAKQKCLDVINNNQAYQKFLDFVKFQKGDITKLKISPYSLEVKANEEGILTEINAHKIALLARSLGCFRQTKDDKIDYSVGIVLNKNIGDYININDTLCTLYISNPNFYLNEKDLECFKIEGGKL